MYLTRSHGSVYGNVRSSTTMVLRTGVEVMHRKVMFAQLVDRAKV